MDERADEEAGVSGPPPGNDPPPEEQPPAEEEHQSPQEQRGRPDHEFRAGQIEQAETATSRTGTVVLNGLADVVAGERSVLVDGASERVLEEIYESVTTAEERAVCAETLAAATGTADDASDGSVAGKGVVDEQTLTEVVGATTEELAARGATLVVDHEVPLALDERPVRVHRFFATMDDAILSSVSDDQRVVDAIERAATAARAGNLRTAASSFEAAIEPAEDFGAKVATRVLAAWAYHRAGEDEAALEHVRDALRHDAGAWDARLVGVSADHSSPEWFREGRLASEAYLRVRTAIPEAATVAAGVADDADGSVDWLDGDPTCYPVEELPLDGQLRLRLSGPPGDLPALHAYYLAVGVIEPESLRPRTVEETLLDGPMTGSASERLQIRLE